jgi:hypothetical protein
MRQHRASRRLEHGKVLLIDSAIYACKPVTSSALKECSRSPLQRYIRHLFFDYLDAHDDFGPEGPEAPLLKHLRCLPWAECREYTLRVALKVRSRFAIEATSLLYACQKLLHQPHRLSLQSAYSRLSLHKLNCFVRRMMEFPVHGERRRCCG